MKKTLALRGPISAFVLLATLALPRIVAAQEELVRTEWPSAEDPGLPFYARVELLPPFIFNDGDWAAIVFYRDPGCVPADFNLISVFDFARAFSCPATVHGDSLWHGNVFNGAPKIVHISGDGAVPVWFVPWEAVKDEARPDGILTRADLEQVQGRLVGYANTYVEELQPHADPNIGGGGHPNPKMIVHAHGRLEDGRNFMLHISWVRDVVRAIRIRFE